MKTREQLNAEAEKIDNQIEKEQWVFQAAMISMVVVYLGIPVGFFSPTLGGWCIILGFFGMVLFSMRCSYLSVCKKELRQQWNANGYGLKKYPLV